MANQRKRIEPLYMGDFGKWSDEAERLARDARRNQRIADIQQCARGARKGIWDLQDEPGKYIDNAKATSATCRAVTETLLSASNLLEEFEAQWGCILADTNHPSKEEAIRALDQLLEDERTIQNCSNAFSEATRRLAAAYKRGSIQHKADK